MADPDSVPDPLEVKRLDDGRRELLKPLSRVVYGREVCVHAGFVTDFSSDPIGLLDWSKVDVAGVVHDYLYNPCSDDDDGKPTVSRWRADCIWFKIATSGKWQSSPITAALGWVGMRVFGGLFWKKGRARWLRYMTVVVGAGLLAWAHYMAFFTEASWGIAIALGKVVCLNVVVVVDVRIVVSGWRSWQRKRLARK